MSKKSKRVINVQLDEQSLKDAATLLRNYQNQFYTAMRRAMDNLAWALEPMIQQDFAYAGYIPGEGRTPDVIVAPKVDRDGLGFTITVQGQEVGFLEFGAGIWSDYMHPFADDVPFNVYMGSFSESEDGKGTWLKWLQDGKDPMKYPYNREPRYGLLHASQYIKDHAMEYVREELGRIAI